FSLSGRLTFVEGALLSGVLSDIADKAALANQAAAEATGTNQMEPFPARCADALVNLASAWAAGGTADAASADRGEAGEAGEDARPAAGRAGDATADAPPAAGGARAATAGDATAGGARVIRHVQEPGCAASSASTASSCSTLPWAWGPFTQPVNQLQAGALLSGASLADQ
ncbi:MAG: hypothetical protein ACYDH5_09925, partial [Acidimicrobiales bacterium]